MTSVGVAGFDFKLPPHVLFKEIKKLGINRCELVTPGDIDLLTANQVLEYAQESEVQITAVGSLSKPNLGEDPTDALELLKNNILVAEKIKTERVITYFGGHETRDKTYAIARYTKLVKPLVELAEELGIKILIENHFSHSPGEVTNTAKGCIDLIDSVNSPNFAVNLDACNFAIGGQDIMSAFELLKPYICNIHVKDARKFNPVQDSSYDGRIVKDLVYGDFLFCSVGQGITDNESIIRALIAEEINVPVTVEVHVPERLLRSTFQAGIDHCRSWGLR